MESEPSDKDNLAKATWPRRIFGLARKNLHWAGQFVLRAFAELTAVIMGLACAWLAMLVAIMAQGELDVSFLKQNFSLWFAQAYDGQEADISTFKVQWHPGREAIGLSAEGINVKDADDQTLLTVGSIYTETPVSALLKRGFEARRLDLEGGQFTILRGKDGAISGAIGGPVVFGRLGPIISIAAPEGGDGGGLIDAVSLRGTDVFFRDQATGLSLDFKEVGFQTDISETEIAANGSAIILTPEDSPALDVSVRRSLVHDKALGVSINITGLNPAHIKFEDERFQALSKLNMPINLTTDWYDAGAQVRRVEFSAQSAEDSESVPDVLWPQIGALKAFSIKGVWDIAADELSLRDIEVDTVDLNAAASLQLANVSALRGQDETPVDISLGVDALSWAAEDILQNPLEITNGDINGTYFHSQNRFELNDLSLPISDYIITATGALDNIIRAEDDTPLSVRLQGGFDGTLSEAEFLDLWPVNFILGGRNWIETAIIDAALSNVKFDVDIPNIPPPEGRLPDEAIKLDFNFSGGLVKYIQTMTPLEQAQGYGQLRANSLDVTLTGGVLGDLAINKGTVTIPQFFPRGSDFTLDFEGTGPVAYMVELIDQKPFEYARIYNLLPQDFAGLGTAKLNITRPLRVFFDRNLIRYDVAVTGTDIAAPFGLGNFKLTEGDLLLTADKTGMRLQGPAKIGPFDSHINWRENFDFGATPTRLSLTTHVNNTVLDKLGLGLREFFGGDIPVQVEATGEGVSFDAATVKADLSGGEMVFGDFWTKPAGKAGNLSLAIARNSDGQIAIEDMNISAPGLELDGGLKLGSDFRLLEAALDRVSIEALIDARITARRESASQPLIATLSGDYLNLDGVVSSALQQGEASGASLPIILSANLNSLSLAPDYIINKASLVYNHSGEDIEQFRFSGASVDGPVILDLQTKDDGPYAAMLNFDIANASEAAGAFFSLDSLSGGRLYGEAVRPRNGEELIWSGFVNVDDFKLVNAPLMAQILSLASLDGLGNVLNGDGLEFETVELPFTWGEGKLGLESARAAGPALGLTGDGTIDIGARTLDIDGTLIPAYAANSFLGSIPILGDILGGNSDDATLGLTYTVGGGFNEAQVNVNPLSALTPGILRKIFKPEREKKRIELPSERSPNPNSLKAEP